jgi:hypothetical protein
MDLNLDFFFFFLKEWDFPGQVTIIFIDMSNFEFFIFCLNLTKLHKKLKLRDHTH